MSSIGRLPTPASAGIGSTVEDDELELLSLQLSTTAEAHKKVGQGDFPLSPSKDQFSTHPRKRQKQKSLMTLWSDRLLLDEIQSEGIRHLLQSVQYQWDFSAFSLDRLSNGSNLPTLCTYLFQHHNLISHFKLDSLTTWKFFALVERGYHSANPYHNSAHAADVTQAMACFILERSIIKYLTPCEIMAALVAAVCHDIDHPGLNEKFLIATSSHLAGLYENGSVLENHHWKSALSILWESGFAQMMTTEDRLEMEGIIRELILATDISRQAEFLAHLRQYQDTGEMDLSLPKYRHFILQIALKCADISNPCRSWNISRLWSYRACEEFFRQGDRERELGLPVTQICDRQNISIAKVQSGFYKYVAAPLFEEWNRFLSSPLSNQMLNNLTSNQARWDLVIQRETARSASMAESVASQISSSSSSGGGSLVGGGTSSRRESMDPHISHQRLSRSSMEGEDDSDPCASYPYMQFELNNPNRATLPISMCSRRHSLPVQTEAFVRLLNTPMTSTNNDEHSSRQHSNGQSNCHPSVPSQPPGLGPHFVRQYSFGERRRSLRQPQFVSTEPQYIPGGMRPLATNRRRLFAGVRAPMISAVESLSSSSSSGSGSVGGGSVEKGNGASFDHDTPFTNTANANVAADYKSGHRNRGANQTSLNINDSKEYPQSGYNDTNFLSKSEHQNQHRSVTFQVSRSSESSDTSKDDFQLELDPFKNLATANIENDFNSPEQQNSSPRRGSAPCNLLINQINANYLRMVANSVPLNGNDRNENQQIISQAQDEDYFDENTTQYSRRGSLPVNLKCYNLNAIDRLNNTSEQEFDDCSTTNKEYRLNYAAKRREMAHCKKLLDRNSSFNDEMLPPAGRPPMLSQNASLRSSSFGGIGENGNYNEQPNDNFLRFLPATSPAAARSTNDNMDNFAHLLMYRRASAPIHRQSSLSRVPGKDPRASFTVLDDEIHQHTRGNTNINFGAVTERFGSDQSSPAAQPVNYNSTPSLSTLLARERIHAVQSTIQLLHNNEDSSLQGNHHRWDPSEMSPNSNNSSAKLFQLNDVVNNCINDVNRSSLIDGSISTTNSNSASIRRGSLPTDFHFYNSFGVC